MCVICSKHKRMGKEINMVRKANIVEVQGLAGGKGIAEMHHIVPAEDLVFMALIHNA